MMMLPAGLAFVESVVTSPAIVVRRPDSRQSGHTTAHPPRCLEPAATELDFGERLDHYRVFRPSIKETQSN